MALPRNSGALAQAAIARLRAKHPWILAGNSSSDFHATPPPASIARFSSSCARGSLFRLLPFLSQDILYGSKKRLHSLAARYSSASTAFAFEQPHTDSQDATQSREIGGEGIDISKLLISPVLISGLAKRGITTLFPIQRAVLEPALKGQDLIARAKTGTGKTLAFGIPILDRILKEHGKQGRGYGRAPLAVVLAPTRELAKQVETELKETGPSVEVACVYGGVSIEPQVRQMQTGVDVMVGTPGRVLDLLNRNSLNLGQVQYFVLDEADRMLAMGFEEDVEKIVQHLPSQKQSLLFSATVPDWVRKLAGKYLKNHIVVDLVGDNDEKIAEGIKLLAIATTTAARRPMLSDLITVYGKGCKSIIFTQTKREADDISLFLGQKMDSEALHGDISQHQREKTLRSFRDGRLNVLVATDVAARGLDISNVDLVVHYEIANDTETFVHRSGRTGRAGKKGTAILMYMEQQRRNIDSLERELGCKFEHVEPPTLEDVIKSSAHQAVTKIENISTELRNVFLPTAEKLISEHGAGALAAAIAHVCGCAHLPTSRSLISYEQGFMTLKVTRPGGEPISGPEAVTQFISRVLPSAASSIGKIRMLNEIGVQGAVFDLPEQLATNLLAMNIATGEILEAPKKLPRIVEDTFTTGGYGRSFSPRGPTGRFNSGGFSGGNSWSSSGRFQGSTGNNDGFSRPSSFGTNWSNRPSSGGSDWSNRSSSGTSNWPSSANSDWSSRSTSGINNWSNRSSEGSGSLTNRSASGYSSPIGSSFGSSFSGSGTSATEVKCLRCGKLGHRIGDCYEKLN